MEGGQDIVTQQGTELLGLQVGLGRNQAAGEQSDAVVVAEVVEPFADPLPHVLGRLDRQQRTGYGVGVGRQRYGYLLDLGAQFRQGSGSGSHRLGNVRFHHVGMEQLGNNAHTLTSDVTVERLPVVGHRSVPGGRVLRVVARDGRQGDGGVLHGAGDGANGVHGPHAAHQTVAADPSPAGPQPDDAAPCGGAADGTAGVLAQGSGAEEGRGSRPRPAAGAACGDAQVPRVTGGAEAVGEPGDGKLAEVRRAEQNCASVLQVGNDCGVIVGNEVGGDARAAGGANALGPDLVFDPHGYPVHRAAVVACQDFLFSPPRLFQCLLMKHGDEGVELEVEVVNPLQVGLDHLHRRHFFTLNETGKG